jgi:hypothetical protein
MSARKKKKISMSDIRAPKARHSEVLLEQTKFYITICFIFHSTENRKNKIDLD